MKKYKAIMFDLDGTLLPMDMNRFMKGYFTHLCMKLAPFEIDSKTVVDAVWAGTHAMVRNDGSRKNMDAFWQVFLGMTGISKDSGIQQMCDEFYSREFHNVKEYTMENPLAAEAVKAAREAADLVILATNPFFPLDGQKTRMSWVGLKEEDFDLITSYESDSFCKPNPLYYMSICERLGIKPEECLHIGNDEDEDMYAASKAGIGGLYLITDTMIASEKHPWQGSKGNFEEMLEMLKKLA